MFSPATAGFLDFKKEEVIIGPNDRSAIGFDNYFPIDWLIEDHDFTREEAEKLINLVHKGD